jgi:Family of unknown function (DUF6247)
MSLSHVEKIATPGGLKLPKDEKVFEEMTNSDRARFAQQLLAALWESQRLDDLWPVRKVVESWYRTLLMRRLPEYEAAHKWARESRLTRDEALDSDEVRDALGL